MTDAIILHAQLHPTSSDPSWHEPLLQALPYAHRLELERRDAMARRASLAGLGLVLMGAECVARRPFAPRAFAFPYAGKPRLADGPHFSVSHSHYCVACIVCAGIECGIDIEDLPEAAGAGTVAKLQRWTATEAALKAAGLGLRAAADVDVTTAPGAAVVRGERYELQVLDALPGVIGCIAARTKLSPVIEAVELGGAPTSALLERSFGLAVQVE
jgi:phosphopantetheinyl transferase